MHRDQQAAARRRRGRRTAVLGGHVDVRPAHRRTRRSGPGVASNGPCSAPMRGEPVEVAGVAGVEDPAARAGDDPGAPQRAVAGEARPEKCRAAVAVKRTPATVALSSQSSSMMRSAGTPQRSQVRADAQRHQERRGLVARSAPDGVHVEVVVVVVRDHDRVERRAGRPAATAAGAAASGRPAGTASSGRSRPGRAAPARPSISTSAEAWPYQVMCRPSGRAAGGCRHHRDRLARGALASWRAALARPAWPSRPGPSPRPAPLRNLPSRNCGERRTRSARAPDGAAPSWAGTSLTAQASAPTAAAPMARPAIRRTADRFCLAI